MKGQLVTLPVRRAAAALALTAALVTAGCGTAEAGRAAVVDGRVIAESEVRSTMEQVNAMGVLQQPLTSATALTALVRSAPALTFFEENGVVASRSVAVQAARDAGVADPGEGTIEVLRFFNALNTAAQSQKFTADDEQELVARIAAQDVTVNPRYGDFDPTAAAVSPVTPPWIGQSDSPS